MTIKNYAFLAALAVVATAGCGAREPEATPTTWTSPRYHLQTTYPSTWKVDSQEIAENPRTGETRIAVFRKPGKGEEELRVMDRPPKVKIIWRPQPQQQAQDTDPGVGVERHGELGIPVAAGGITQGWEEFQARNVQTRNITIGNLPAQEATALASPGSPFFTEQTGGQLVGEDQLVRLVVVRLSTGSFWITRVAPGSAPEVVQEADAIVDSIRLTP